MAESEPTRCLDCGHAIDDRFCPHCGQKNTSYRVSLWLVLKEMVQETFELDGRVPRTLVPFFFKPGFLTREYNAGRRTRYTSPFRLFLAMALLWVFAGFVFTKTTDYEAALQEEGAMKTIVLDVPESDGASTEDSSALGRRIEKRLGELSAMSQAEQVEHVFEGALEALPKAIFVLLPIFALILELLFLGTRRFYVEHLVFALHVHAMAYFVLALSFLVEDDLLSPLLPAGLAIYVFLALRNAYAAGWLATIGRFVGLVFAYGVCFLVVLVVMLAAVVLL